MSEITIVVPLGPNGEIEGLGEIEKQIIKVIPVYGTNPSKNRNEGVRKVKTDYVAFINGHTLISPDWLKQTKTFLRKNPEIDIVGGPQLTSKNESLFGLASGYALSSKFGAANVSTRYRTNKLNLNADETMLTTANLICKKSVFKKVNFDEHIYPGEDPKFISDALKAGFRVAYSPEITVYNKRRTNIASFIKQIFSYGFTRPKKENLKETLKKPFFLVPSFFLIYLLLLPSLFLINKHALFPIYCYIFINIFFSLYESLKNKKFYLIFILPWLFLVIHITYGLGFIFGTLNKLKL